MQTFRGTIVDYLDFLEKQLTSHILHRNLVSSEYRCKKDYERNIRPWIVARDQDFSENGTIENFDKIQSEHWQTIQYTLFMAILSFLLVDEWNKQQGELEIGSEVTVNGELYIRDPENPHYRPQINPDSYWATVTSKIDDNTYSVTDADGKITNIERSRLRLRKLHTIASPAVSDDKKHDRFAMQHFKTHELEWVETYITCHLISQMTSLRVRSPISIYTLTMQPSISKVPAQLITSHLLSMTEVDPAIAVMFGPLEHLVMVRAPLTVLVAFSKIQFMA